MGVFGHFQQGLVFARTHLDLLSSVLINKQELKIRYRKAETNGRQGIHSTHVSDISIPNVALPRRKGHEDQCMQKNAVGK